MTHATREESADLSYARRRASMLHAARQFFNRYGVLEVETPLLSRSAVSDPQIESIAVSVRADALHGYYLHTSPEFAMKRLLCAGWPDIYQICRVFRDGEIGRRHQPEFTLVEWYRRGLTLSAMMQHTADFISILLGDEKVPHAADYLSYVDAFVQHAGVNPLTASVPELIAASPADTALQRTLGDEREAWLDLLLSQTISTQFAEDRLTVLHHYPVAQAALARRCPQHPQLADRFEVFLGDLELANGYFELADAGEQRNRLRHDQQVRRRRGQLERPLDADFLAALEDGLPPCCGVAVGLDRLLMLACDTQDIRDVLTFAFPTSD